MSMPSDLIQTDRRRFWIGAAALAAIGLALRLWNIDFGLPIIYHPDEQKKFIIIDWIIRGTPMDYNFLPLIHPGFMVSLTAGVSAVGELFGMRHDPSSIILCGRILSALFSTGTIVVTALLGATLASRRAGLMAAAIVAFSPLLVVHSRYLKEDSFMTLFTTMCMLGAAWWMGGSGRRRRAGLILCAAAAGFAASTKYVGLVFPVLLLGLIVFSRNRSRRDIALFIAICVLTFALGSSQLLMHPRDAWSQISGALSRGAEARQTSTPLMIYQWPDMGTFFLLHGINQGLGWPLTVVGVFATAMALKARRRHPAVWFTAIAIVTWYFVTELTPLKRPPDSERYILPCVPLMAALAARFLDAPRPSRGLWLVLGWVCVAALAVHSAALARALRPDTREIASRWLFNEYMGRKPRPIAYLQGSIEHQVSHQLLPGCVFVRLRMPGGSGQWDAAPAAKCEVLAISHFVTDRYEDYPALSPQAIESLNKLRSEFPYVKIFEKPRYAQAGFHNPVIELRFRHDFEK